MHDRAQMVRSCARLSQSTLSDLSESWLSGLGARLRLLGSGISFFASQSFPSDKLISRLTPLLCLLVLRLGSEPVYEGRQRKVNRGLLFSFRTELGMNCVD